MVMVVAEKHPGVAWTMLIRRLKPHTEETSQRYSGVNEVSQRVGRMSLPAVRLGGVFPKWTRNIQETPPKLRKEVTRYRLASTLTIGYLRGFT